MKKIRLSSKEKQVLRMLINSRNKELENKPNNKIIYAIDLLEKKGLINVIRLTDGTIWNIKISNVGKSYIKGNPKLINPINWKYIFEIIALIISLISLLLML